MRLWKVLRSRRLAIYLLVGITLYAWVVTLVPLSSQDPVAAAAWDLKHPVLAIVVNALWLHRAYSSPAFIAAAAMLTASTAACSWERTRAAFKAWRSQHSGERFAIERIGAVPAFVIDVRAGVEDDSVLTAATSALRQSRMKVRRSGDCLSATSGTIGLIGSPLFHWALVGLFIFAALGQLTHYEGTVSLVVGETSSDRPATYASGLKRGAFVRPSRFTGLNLKLTAFDQNYVADGVSRGSAARVRLSREGSTVAEQWVFPDSPLRYAPLMIHRAAGGPALVATVSDLSTIARQRVILYYDENARSHRIFKLTDPATATTLTVEVSPLGEQRVSVVVTGDSRGATQTVGVGETARLTDTISMTIDSLTYYARIQVVNDWSVPYVYAMFVLGIIGAALTTFVPPRQVLVAVVDGPDGLRLRARATHRRNDPAFPRLAERILRDGLSEYAALDVAPPAEREGNA